MFVLKASLKSLALSFKRLQVNHCQAHGRCVHYKPYWPGEAFDLCLGVGCDRLTAWVRNEGI